MLLRSNKTKGNNLPGTSHCFPCVAWWAAVSNNQSTCGLNGDTKTETRSKRQFEKIILEAAGKGITC